MRKSAGSESMFSRQYDVCFSFAGEDRAYVQKVAGCLKQAGVRVFYDRFEESSLWGKDLYTHLDEIYQNQAAYCVVFISRFYAAKSWTNHERASAQARAIVSSSEYILPVRFDDTQIPGIRETVGYIDLRTTTPEQLGRMIIDKVGPRPRENYLPPYADKLFKAFKARSNRDKEFLTNVLHRFHQALSRMSMEERGLIYDIFTTCCPAELPENVHIHVDLLRRISGMSTAKIERLLTGIRSLGFYHTIRSSHNPDDPNDLDGPIVVLEWQNTAVEDGGNHTLIANAIIEYAGSGSCAGCAEKGFKRLDFGQLATVTTLGDEH